MQSNFPIPTEAKQLDYVLNYFVFVNDRGRWGWVSLSNIEYSYYH